MATFQDRDYIRDIHGDIFHVLGSIHPPSFIYALHKYRRVKHDDQPPYPAHEFRLWIPKDGTGRFYRVLPKYSATAARANMADHPYSRMSSIFQIPMIHIPEENVAVHFHPQARLQGLLSTINSASFSNRQRLDVLERETIEAALTLEELYHIPLSSQGVTGSILWESHHSKSDIDLMVYGRAATKKLAQSPERLSPDRHGLRGYRNIEIFPLAQKMADRSALSAEECFECLYHTRYLFFFNDRKVSVTFAPAIDEIPFYPAFLSDSRFDPVGEISATITVRATILADEWGYYYPGFFAIRVASILQGPANEPVHPSQITRLLVFEHSLVGYYQAGDTVEICGMLQQCHDVPAYPGYGVHDTLQILIGTQEFFGREYVRLISKMGGGA